MGSRLDNCMQARSGFGQVQPNNHCNQSEDEH
jgi:hypothetical protein